MEANPADNKLHALEEAVVVHNANLDLITSVTQTPGLKLVTMSTCNKSDPNSQRPSTRKNANSIESDFCVQHQSGLIQGNE